MEFYYSLAFVLFIVFSAFLLAYWDITSRQERLSKGRAFLEDRVPHLHKEINVNQNGVLYCGENLKFIAVNNENLTRPPSKDIERSFSIIIKSTTTGKYYLANYLFLSFFKENVLLENINPISEREVKKSLSKHNDIFEKEFGKPEIA